MFQYCFSMFQYASIIGLTTFEQPAVAAAMKNHMLIVKDELMVQGLLALHLKNEGYAVSSAATGKAS